MKKLILAAVLAGFAFFGGMTADAAGAPAPDASAFRHYGPGQYKLPEDVSFGLFGRRRYDPLPPMPGDRHDPPPPPPPPDRPGIGGPYGPYRPNAPGRPGYGPFENN